VRSRDSPTASTASATFGVDGRRFLDVLAECKPFVTDEEPACTIRARFDVATERLVEFEAS